MKPAEFESQFHQYLDHIEEAKLKSMFVVEYIPIILRAFGVC